MTKFLNISTDNTLGGNSPSDELAVSQKAIKDYVDQHSGGGAAIDNSTITTNSQNKIQAVATVNANSASGATTPLYDWVGTIAEYEAQDIETLHPEWVCFITDDVAEAGDAHPYHPCLLSWEWDDHLRNDVQWLRGDTFSWQDGGVYEEAYNHLVADISGKSIQTETIAGTTISFYLADDGHKICPSTEEGNAIAIYAATGAAWYYILDTVGEKFKLPRAKHAKFGDIGVVGDGKVIGVTDGTNNYGMVTQNTYYTTGCLVGSKSNYGDTPATSGASAGEIANTSKVGLTLDPTKSGIVAKPDQETNQYKYLYFYVGQFTQTALENTAGLNAELFNAKADTNLSNVTSGAKESVVSWAMPDYTNGINMSNLDTYQKFNEDGFVSFSGSGSGGWSDIGIDLSNDGSTLLTRVSVANQYGTTIIIPLPKNTYVKKYGVTSKITFYPCKKS